jgi:glucose/arabinose dehydrogenase
LLKEPLIDVNVGSKAERGMLGIAVANDNQTNGGPRYVFLYYTETKTKDGEDITEKKDPLGNRLYRYELVNNKLVKPKLLLDLPAKPGSTHNGGAMTIGPDNYIYLTVGNLDNVYDQQDPKIKTQNIINGEEPDGSGGILRITQSGKVVGHGIIGNKYPSNLYYAYGIRNSFGIDFDPSTGNLWDSENGAGVGDELNLVKAGFNSGWMKVQGIWQKENGYFGNVSSSPPEDLVDFNGTGKYSAPELSWNYSIGITSLKFFDSNKLGSKYENDLFVGDFHNGNLYNFDLNNKRNELNLDRVLHDKVADNSTELKNVIIGHGFGGITDIETGPDGYLYILSLRQGGAECQASLPVPWTLSKECINYSAPINGIIYKISTRG